MDFNKQDTAVVITDPQNDFLSPEGVTWGLVGGSVEENGTVGHIEDLFQAAKQKRLQRFHFAPLLPHGQGLEVRRNGGKHDARDRNVRPQGCAQH